MIKKDGMVEKERLLTWREVDPGGQVMRPGSSESYKTSDWAVRTMQWNPDTCIHCLFCWSICPDYCIVVEEEKMVGIDEFYCKGCGLCANACPTDPKSLSFEGFGEGKEE